MARTSFAIWIAFSGVPARLHAAVDELEVLDGDLQLERGRLEQPLADGLGGPTDRAPGGVRDRAAAAARARPARASESSGHDLDDGRGETPSASATIAWKPPATPDMSATPVMTWTLPSAETRHAAAAAFVAPGQ